MTFSEEQLFVLILPSVYPTDSFQWFHSFIRWLLSCYHPQSVLLKSVQYIVCCHGVFPFGCNVIRTGLPLLLMLLQGSVKARVHKISNGQGQYEFTKKQKLMACCGHMLDTCSVFLRTFHFLICKLNENTCVLVPFMKRNQWWALAKNVWLLIKNVKTK